LGFKPSHQAGYGGARACPQAVGEQGQVGLLVAASTLVSPASAAPANIAGMIVFLDPGHNGSNDGSISRQVPTGRGGTKDCQASGTSSDDGYPEHTFTWDTTLRIRQALTALGVRTAMSRGDDTGLGPCVDERANMANALRPNAIVSIHGDGGPPTGRGFHVLYSSPPLNQVQAGPAVQFARSA
jgi:N-acetylmuramoyl-L-alanine amidase